LKESERQLKNRGLCRCRSKSHGDKWMRGGLGDWRTGGLEDWRTGGLEDWRTRGLEDWRFGGLEDGSVEESE
jgi:hypothetical protein